LYEKLSVGFATLVNPSFLSYITTTMLVLSRSSVLAYEAPALVPAGDTTPTIQRLGRNLYHTSIQVLRLSAQELHMRAPTISTTRALWSLCRTKRAG
jgi:hypothetical protein